MVTHRRRFQINVKSLPPSPFLFINTSSAQQISLAEDVLTNTKAVGVKDFMFIRM